VNVVRVISCLTTIRIHMEGNADFAHRFIQKKIQEKALTSMLEGEMIG